MDLPDTIYPRQFITVLRQPYTTHLRQLITALLRLPIGHPRVFMCSQSQFILLEGRYLALRWSYMVSRILITANANGKNMNGANIIGEAPKGCMVGVGKRLPVSLSAQ